MSQAHKDYFDALERLKHGRTTVLPPGTAINNDSVSLEAGRKVGSIKRSRKSFDLLISQIVEAAEEQQKGLRLPDATFLSAKAEAEEYRSRWEAGLQRELSLYREYMHLKKQLALLNNSKVIPLRPGNADGT